MSSDPPAGSPQRRMDARRTIAPATLGMGLADVVQKRAVLDTAPALWPTPPSIVSTGRDPEHRADGAHGPDVTMLIHEPEAHRVAAPKMSAAFFKMSRSVWAVNRHAKLTP
jgi:hypothetical protein